MKTPGTSATSPPHDLEAGQADFLDREYRAAKSELRTELLCYMKTARRRRRDPFEILANVTAIARALRDEPPSAEMMAWAAAEYTRWRRHQCSLGVKSPQGSSEPNDGAG